MQDLGILPGNSECRATAINGSGQVVGPCAGQGFLWTADTGMTPLPIPTPNYPLGINGQGDIVGVFGTPPHAFLYRNDHFEDLGWSCSPPRASMRWDKSSRAGALAAPSCSRPCHRPRRPAKASVKWSAVFIGRAICGAGTWHDTRFRGMEGAFKWR